MTPRGKANEPAEGSDVDWASLSHAYGKAKDTPGHLRDLIDADCAVRENARYQLGASLAHQGTRYKATAPSVPLVIAALEAEHVDLPQTLDLLCSFANGDDAAWWLTGHPPGGKASGIGGFGKKAYVEVVKGLRRYVALLAHADPEVRSSAAHLLAWLGTEAKATRAPIAARLDVEPEAPALASLLLALAYLGDERDRTAIHARLADTRREVREAAAVALLHLGAVDERVIDVLGAILRDAKPKLHWWDLRPRQLDQAIFGWPLPEDDLAVSPWGPLASIVSAHLPMLIADRPRDVLALRVALREGDTHEASAAGLCAIETIAAPDADPELRRRLLTAYALRDRIWTGRVAETLAKHGLPDRPPALRAHLGLPPRETDMPRRLRGAEQPPVDALEAARAAGATDALLDELAGFAPAEAWSIAKAWSMASVRPAPEPADVAARLAVVDGIDAVVEADAVTWRRAGALPQHVDAKGSPLIAAPYARLAVEVGLARAAAGHVPGPWLEATIGWLVEYRDLDAAIRALEALPVARRVAVVRWALAKEAYDVMARLAPLAPVPEVIEPTVDRLAAWGSGSQIDRYEGALVAFGPPAVPSLERVLAQRSLAPATRKVFAAAKKRLAVG